MSEQTRWLRAATVVLLAAMALGGCGDAPDRTSARPGQPAATRSGSEPTNTPAGPGSTASDGLSATARPPTGRCLDRVARGQTFYVRSTSTRTPRLGSPVDDVVRPGCDDTGGPPPPDTPLTAWSIWGAPVGAALAVVAPDGSVAVYVAEEAEEVTWQRADSFAPSAHLDQDGRLTLTAYGSSSCPPVARSATVVGDGLLRVRVSDPTSDAPGGPSVICTMDMVAHTSSVDVTGDVSAQQPVVAVLVGPGRDGLAVPVAR